MTIDWWTLGLQTVNVLILIWLLGRFFWRPMAALIAERRSSIAKILADAEEQRSDAATAQAAIEQTRSGFTKERDAVLAAARQGAEEQHAERLRQAEAEAAAVVAAARAQAETDRIAAERAWVERAARLAVDIAARLARRLNGPALRATFLDGLVRELEALPALQRATLAADAATLDAVSAEPLDAAEQERCRAAIEQALHAQPPVRFSVEPALIAGLELRAAHLVVSNSWRADLDRILGELTHERR